VKHAFPGEHPITLAEPPPKDARLKLALIYPDTYHMGLSNLGLHALYGLLAERTPFVPRLLFYQQDLGLYRHRSLAGKRRGVNLRDFDVIAFTIPFELLYVNVLRILREQGIGLTPAERAGAPLIIAGGYSPTGNPQPLAEVLDVAFIGEAEEAFPPFLDEVLANLAELKSPRGQAVRDGLLQRWHGRPGFYCPRRSAEARVKRHYVADATAHVAVSRIVTPDTAFASRLLVQSARGCAARCDFCLAGCTTHPLRVVDADTLLRSARLAQGITRRIGFIAESPGDHPAIADVTAALVDEGCDVSFSSLRLSSINDAMLASLLKCGQQTVTIAPEVLDENYRRRLHKPYPPNAEILQRSTELLAAGIKRIKYYFMLGFEFENESYLSRLARWLEVLDAEARKVCPKGEPPVAFSFSYFVPKAHTPLELYPLPPVAALDSRRKTLKKLYRGRAPLKFESAEWSLLQERLSRGGRETLELLLHLAAQRLTTPVVKSAIARFELEHSAAHPVRHWAGIEV